MTTPTGADSTDERVVLPRRSYAWRAGHGYLVLGLIAIVGALVWALDEDALLGPLVLATLGVCGWTGFVLWFRRDEDLNRLAIDAFGISSLRRGAVVETTEWAHMTYVEFDSGSRFANWDKYGTGILGFVRCHDDRPHDRWNPSDVGAFVALPVFGRRGLRDIDDTLRAACAAHDVGYRSYWLWTWRISLRRKYRRHPDPRPPRRPW